MKAGAYFLFSVFILALIVFIYHLHLLVKPPTSKADLEFLYLQPFISGVIVIFSLLLGIYFLKNSKAEHVSDLEKELIVSIVFNGIIGVTFFCFAVYMFFEGVSLSIQEPLSVAFYLAGPILFTAFVFTLLRKVYPSYLLMIIGGIIILPLGIIPIFLGIRLKKYKGIYLGGDSKPVLAKSFYILIGSVNLSIVFLMVYSMYFHKERQSLDYDSESVGEDFEFILLTDKASLEAGEKIYNTNCASCHGTKAEGRIGPNHTDDYWIHGGEVKNMAKTILNGVPEKGMISWRGILTDNQIQEVISYIYTLQGTNPPN
jgi:hypothetical protein